MGKLSDLINNPNFRAVMKAELKKAVIGMGHML